MVENDLEEKDQDMLVDIGRDTGLGVAGNSQARKHFLCRFGTANDGV